MNESIQEIVEGYTHAPLSRVKVFAIFNINTMFLLFWLLISALGCGDFWLVDTMRIFHVVLNFSIIFKYKIWNFKPHKEDLKNIDEILVYLQENGANAYLERVFQEIEDIIEDKAHMEIKEFIRAHTLYLLRARYVVDHLPIANFDKYYRLIGKSLDKVDKSVYKAYVYSYYRTQSRFDPQYAIDMTDFDIMDNSSFGLDMLTLYFIEKIHILSDEKKRLFRENEAMIKDLDDPNYSKNLIHDCYEKHAKDGTVATLAAIMEANKERTEKLRSNLDRIEEIQYMLCSDIMYPVYKEEES